MKNIPKQIHLIPNGVEENELKEIKDFDDLDHEFTYWAQGTDKKPELNYIQQKEMNKFKNKVSDLISQLEYEPTVNKTKDAYKKLLKLLK